MARYIERGKEDEALFERLSMSLDDAMRVDVQEALSPQPRTWAQQRRELERQASLHSDATRYQSGIGGWRAAGR